MEPLIENQTQQMQCVPRTARLSKTFVILEQRLVGFDEHVNEVGLGRKKILNLW